jgi:hypothetical protein
MLALFLDHTPIFVAGEIALGISLAMFTVALVNAIPERSYSAIARSPSFSSVGQSPGGADASRPRRLPASQ